MSKVLTFAACATVVILSDVAIASSAKEVFAEVAGSVVVVVAVDGAKPVAQGSGVVVSRNEVATNCHIVSGSKKIAVIQAGDAHGRETYRMTATLAARNDERDLCLLYVEELSGPPGATPVSLGGARDVSVGEEVYAIGAPRGLELSLSRGIVSQLRGAYGKRSAPLIQTDAAVSPGSSGGGLFNENGELIGITSFKYAGDASEGLSFAVPVEWVKELLAVQEEWAACLSSPTAGCMFARARILAEGLTSAYSRADALHWVAEVQLRAGDDVGARATVAEARRTAGQVEDAYSRAQLLRFISNVQARAGDETGARESLAEAIRAAKAIDNPESRRSTLAYIAEGQARAGDTAGTLRTAGQLDLPYATYALRDIAGAQARRGDITGALGTAGRIDDVQQHAMVLNSIIEVQIQTGDITGALSMVERIEDVFQRERSLNTIAEARAKNGDITGAMQTAKKINHYPHLRSIVLRKIAEAQAKAGNITEALRTADFIADWRPHAMALGTIARVQAQSGEGTGARATIARAMQSAERVGNAADRTNALVHISKAQDEAGDSRGAETTLRKATGNAGHIDLKFSRNSALWKVAEARAMRGDVAEAYKTADRIERKNVRSFALQAIAEAQAFAGDVAGGLKTLDRIDSKFWRALALARFAARITETE